MGLEVALYICAEKSFSYSWGQASVQKKMTVGDIFIHWQGEGEYMSCWNGHEDSGVWQPSATCLGFTSFIFVILFKMMQKTSGRSHLFKLPHRFGSFPIQNASKLLQCHCNLGFYTAWRDLCSCFLDEHQYHLLHVLERPVFQPSGRKNCYWVGILKV